MPALDADTTGTLQEVGNKINDIRERMKNQKDFMSLMYNEGIDHGWLTYAICWYVMFFQMIGFLVVYFKRVLIIAFLSK